MAKPRRKIVRGAAPAPSTRLQAPQVIEVKAGVFKDTCLQLLDEVHDGELEVVVTKHGVPVARVVPPDVRAPSAFGFLRGTVVAEDDIVSPDLEPWGELG